MVGALTANSGTATVSAGAASALTIETAANGSGSVIGAKAVTAGGNFTGYAVKRDAYGYLVANASATWCRPAPPAGSPARPEPGQWRLERLHGHRIGTGPCTPWPAA